MIALLLGGASSGKSAVAEGLASTTGGPVTYLATLLGGDLDADMAARVAAHRARRPPTWVTVEAAGAALVGVIAATRGTLLIDSLGAWVAGAPGFAVDGDGLCRALRQRAGDTIVVSDEVGLGVHPSSAAGRAFREALGPLNAAVVAAADRAWLVVSGRLLALERAPW